MKYIKKNEINFLLNSNIYDINSSYLYMHVEIKIRCAILRDHIIHIVY